MQRRHKSSKWSINDANIGTQVENECVEQTTAKTDTEQKQCNRLMRNWGVDNRIKNECAQRIKRVIELTIFTLFITRVHSKTKTMINGKINMEQQWPAKKHPWNVLRARKSIAKDNECANVSARQKIWFVYAAKCQFLCENQYFRCGTGQRVKVAWSVQLERSQPNRWNNWIPMVQGVSTAADHTIPFIIKIRYFAEPGILCTGITCYLNWTQMY